MSITAISGSSAASSAYATSINSKKKSGDDPMTQAISSLQSTDPTLASKLSDMQKKVDSMKKSGAPEKDVQSAIKSTMDGLSSTEKSELKSAMPASPVGVKGGHGGHHHAKASSDSDSSSASGADSSIFSPNSLLDSSSSMQNDSIMSLLASRASVM